MELLDMVPAHAIALRIYSLPAAAAAAGSLCACLVAALAAAAVGLWRIRAVGASKAGVGSSLVEDKQAQAPPPPPAAIAEPRPAVRAAMAAEPASSPSASEPSTPSKVRFTAYYGGSVDDDGVVDGARGCADADDDGEVDVVLRRTASAPERRSKATALAAAPWEEREMAVRRRGDLGWYHHLDMVALDGSVVRLWDGELTASPRGRRRRAGLELQLSL